MVWHPIKTIPEDDREYMIFMRHYDNELRKFQYVKEFTKLRYIKQAAWEPLFWMDIPDPDVACE